jgi:hypothetical protein
LKPWSVPCYFAGDTIGGQKVAMTYCALSNLPIAYNSSINGKEANLKVVSQINAQINGVRLH